MKTQNDDCGTILAVPYDKPLILTKEQGEAILAEINNKQRSPDERENIARKVKALFTKPVRV